MSNGSVSREYELMHCLFHCLVCLATGSAWPRWQTSEYIHIGMYETCFTISSFVKVYLFDTYFTFLRVYQAPREARYAATHLLSVFALENNSYEFQ